MPGFVHWNVVQRTDVDDDSTSRIDFALRMSSVRDLAYDNVRGTKKCRGILQGLTSQMDRF